MPHYWLGYVDDSDPENSRAIGAIIVKAGDFEQAHRFAHHVMCCIDGVITAYEFDMEDATDEMKVAPLATFMGFEELKERKLVNE